MQQEPISSYYSMEALLSCTIVAYIACVSSPIYLVSQVNSRTQTSTSVQPWYVSAAAIHRVSLKPSTEYWRFEQLRGSRHLALDDGRAADVEEHRLQLQVPA